MEFQKILPDIRLSHSVVSYVTYYAKEFNQIIDTYYPNGKIAIVFHFKDPIYFKDEKDDWKVMSKISFVSCVNLPVPLRLEGQLDTFAVILHPYSFYNLYKIKLDHKIRSADAGIYFTPELCNKLRLCYDNTNRSAILNQYFYEKFKTYNPKEDNFKKLVDSIIESNGLIERRNLAQKFNISESYIHKLFIQRIGLSFKLYSRIVRISNILEEINYSISNDWFDILLKYRYYDQSHFIKDFKKITNKTPYQYFRYDKSLSAKLSGMK